MRSVTGLRVCGFVVRLAGAIGVVRLAVRGFAVQRSCVRGFTVRLVGGATILGFLGSRSLSLSLELLCSVCGSFFWSSVCGSDLGELCVRRVRVREQMGNVWSENENWIHFPPLKPYFTVKLKIFSVWPNLPDLPNMLFSEKWFLNFVWSQNKRTLNLEEIYSAWRIYVIMVIILKPITKSVKNFLYYFNSIGPEAHVKRKHIFSFGSYYTTMRIV